MQTDGDVAYTPYPSRGSAGKSAKTAAPWIVLGTAVAGVLWSMRPSPVVAPKGAVPEAPAAVAAPASIQAPALPAAPAQAVLEAAAPAAIPAFEDRLPTPNLQPGFESGVDSLPRLRPVSNLYKASRQTGEEDTGFRRMALSQEEQAHSGAFLKFPDQEKRFAEPSSKGGKEAAASHGRAQSEDEKIESLPVTQNVWASDSQTPVADQGYHLPRKLAMLDGGVGGTWIAIIAKDVGNKASIRYNVHNVQRAAMTLVVTLRDRDGRVFTTARIPVLPATNIGQSDWLDIPAWAVGQDLALSAYTEGGNDRNDFIFKRLDLVMKKEGGKAAK